MTSYKTFFIPVRQEFKGKIDIATTWRIDGLALANEIQALLAEYEALGYSFVSQEAVTHSAKSATQHTAGMIVILKKDS